MIVRYVALHHTGFGEAHFDLMIEVDPAGALLTWRCPAWPPADAAACVPLPPHRRIYLDYEGDISGGRGRVRRVAAGVYTLIGASATSVVVVIDGQELTLRKLA